MAKDLKVRVRLTGVQRFKAELASLKSAMRGFGVAVAAIAAASAIAIKGLSKAISQSFKFETMEMQLAVLLKSATLAKKKFEELKEFSTTTPFELPGIVKAYKQLLIFTKGALTTEKGLRLVGDAAAGSGTDFADLAFWTGRLYSQLKNGNPFIDSVTAMQRFGVMGGEVRGKLEAMEKAGASFGEKWSVIESQLLMFEGGMEKLSKTGEGLMSTLRDNWKADVAAFGKAFESSAKEGLQLMIDKLKELRDDNSIQTWAENSLVFLKEMRKEFQYISAFWDSMNQEKNLFSALLTGGLGRASKAASVASGISQVDTSAGPKIQDIDYLERIRESSGYYDNIKESANTNSAMGASWSTLGAGQLFERAYGGIGGKAELGSEGNPMKVQVINPEDIGGTI